MATITSNGTGGGLWSATTSWSGGAVPVDNDAVVIASGDTITFDANTSAWANGVNGMTVTGTFSMNTAATSYLKMKASTTIAGTGTFNAGTSGGAIPFAVKTTITGGNDWKFASGATTLTVNMYGTEPTKKFVTISGTEAVGQTVISVDTDVTGDIWATGDTVLITTLNAATYQTYTIASIAASEITLTGGLTVAKALGNRMYLLSRNLQVSSPVGGATNHRLFDTVTLNAGSGYFSSPGGIIVVGGTNTISGGVFAIGNHIVWGATLNLSGGLFLGSANYGTYNTTINSTGATWYMSATNHGNYGFAGNVDGLDSYDNICSFYNCSYVVISNVTSARVQYALQASCNGIIILNSTFTGGFINGGSSCQIINSTIGNTRFEDSVAYNTLFSGTISSISTMPKYFYSESYDHNKVAGDYFGLNIGAYTYNQKLVLPTGYTDAFITTLTSATLEGYWQRKVSVAAGASVAIDLWLRKPASMTYLPRIIIYDITTLDPLLGGTALKTFTMTDSTDTWEQSTYNYVNETAQAKTLVIRVQGKAASGTFYSALDVDFINVDLTSALAKLDTIDTVVDAIKVKTDPITFTVANQVDSNALSGGGGASASEVADAVWDEDIADHTDTGSTGEKLSKQKNASLLVDNEIIV